MGEHNQYFIVAVCDSVVVASEVTSDAALIPVLHPGHSSIEYPHGRYLPTIAGQAITNAVRRSMEDSNV